MESIFIRMAIFPIFYFILFGFGGTTSVKPIAGGEINVTAEDAGNVKLGEELILNFMEREWANLPNYNTTIVLSDFTVIKQIVAGWLYNYKYKTTIVYKRLNASDIDKPELFLNCSASVWIKPNGQVEIPDEKKPNCT